MYNLFLVLMEFFTPFVSQGLLVLYPNFTFLRGKYLLYKSEYLVWNIEKANWGLSIPDNKEFQSIAFRAMQNLATLSGDKERLKINSLLGETFTFTSL